MFPSAINTLNLCFTFFFLFSAIFLIPKERPAALEKREIQIHAENCSVRRCRLVLNTYTDIRWSLVVHGQLAHGAVIRCSLRMVQKRIRRAKHAEKELFLIICGTLFDVYRGKRVSRRISSFHFVFGRGSVKNGCFFTLVVCRFFENIFFFYNFSNDFLTLYT